MTDTFSAQQLDRQLLLGLTTRTHYDRGLAYVAEERVELEVLGPRQVRAIVSGSEDYQVHLVWRAGTLQGQCDCPVGQRDEFCKHQVATALTWARAAAPSAQAPPHAKRGGRGAAATSPAEPEGTIERWLSTQPAAALQALLLELAESDTQVRKRLLSQAQLAIAPLQDWRKAVSSLLGRKRFLDSRETSAYATQVAALPSLLDQARQRDPVAALDLHEYAFKRLLTIYEGCDDSRGHLGQRIRALAQGHAAAAQLAGAGDLDSRLFELRMLDEWSLLPPLSAYAPLLSDATIARLEHAALSALQDPNCPHVRKLLATSLLEDCARCGGNVEAMLEQLGQRCDTSWDYLEMARRCEEHGRQRQALEWLERGARLDGTDARVLNALADAYLRDGFPEDALQLRWKIYQQRPNVDHYLALREDASLIGQWNSWRERALQALDAKASPYFNPHDQRIGLLLSEDLRQRALALAAERSHDVSVTTWERLLPAAEAEDPPFALRICHQLIDSYVTRANRSGYLAAARLLPIARRLSHRQNDAAAFDVYLADLRQRFRAKRSFIELVNKAAAER